MRKILAILLLIITIIGCSNSEELDVNPNLIIGKWKLESEFYTDGTSYSTDECDRKSTFDFRANNTLDSKKFRMINGNCILRNEERSYIEYKIENNNLEINGTYIDAGKEISFTTLNAIKFPDKNTLEIYFFDVNMNVFKHPSEIWKRID
ncbi:MAG: lipocalin family protein [Lutibacter sp.]|jgi:hypothetical protein